MEYKNVAEISSLWNISERSVRKYCLEGRINGAILVGKTWMIPSNANKPIRKSSSKNLLDILKAEKESKLTGGIYHKIQIDLTYNSNHIEGCKLTHDQTRYIYETNTIGISNEIVNVDDIIETANHFRCIDYIIDKAKVDLSESLIKQLHFILNNGTSDSRKSWFAVGNYKKLPNEVGGKDTTDPKNVAEEISILLKWYNDIANKTINDIIKYNDIILIFIKKEKFICFFIIIL